MKFQLVTRFVAQGQSFWQACVSARTAWGICQNLHFARVTKSTVFQFDQATTVINPQDIKDLVCDTRCWSFNIAIYDATNRKNSYIDFRLWVSLGCKSESFYVLGIPMKDSHTVQLILDLIYRTLEGLLVLFGSSRSSLPTLKLARTWPVVYRELSAGFRESFCLDLTEYGVPIIK